MTKLNLHEIQPRGAQSALPDLLRLQLYANALDLSYQKRIRSVQAGGYLSPFRGRGMEFDEVRGYQPGDDVRMIDWRVTARSGHVHTKLFREERERPVLFFIDQTGSMRFGTRNAFKSVVAAYTASVLAWAAINNSDRIGAIITDSSQHRELKPTGGKRGVLRLLHELTRVSSGGAGTAATDAEFFRAAFLRLCRIARHGSLVYLLSDFRHLDAIRPYFNRLIQHNDVMLVFVYDPMEYSAPAPGFYPVTDGRNRLLWDTTDRGKSLKEKFMQRYNDITQLCRTLHMPMISLGTHQEILHPLRTALHPSRTHNAFVGGIHA